MRVEVKENNWVDKARYDNAEKQYYESLHNVAKPNNCSLLVSEIAKAREHIQSSLEKIDDIKIESCSSAGVLSRIASLETENKEIKALFTNFTKSYNDILKRLALLEVDNKVSNVTNVPKEQKKVDEDDDDVDLFGSDSEEEDAEAARIREERLAKYAEKKATKTAIIAKSSILLDVKPWGDEIDLKKMESRIREIKLDGLLWGASKFVPVAFGIKKVTISCVVEDDKVSIDWLTEEIEKIEDLVQSVDIAAFNKI